MQEEKPLICLTKFVPKAKRLSPKRTLLALHLAALMILSPATPWAMSVRAQDDEGTTEAIPWVDPEPIVVSLKGFLVEKRYYGSPGFGETPKEDKKTEAWILLLEPPINRRAKEKSEIDDPEWLNVKQLQLVVFSNEKHLFKKLHKFLGQEVYATGTLYTGYTAWYWTLDAMHLQDISLVPRDTRGADLKW